MEVRTYSKSSTYSTYVFINYFFGVIISVFKSFNVYVPTSSLEEGDIVIKGLEQSWLCVINEWKNFNTNTHHGNSGAWVCHIMNFLMGLISYLLMNVNWCYFSEKSCMFDGRPCQLAHVCAFFLLYILSHWVSNSTGCFWRCYLRRTSC